MDPLSIRPVTLLLWVACAAPAIASEPASEPLLLEVAAGKHDRLQTPVTFELPASWRGEEPLSLARVDNGRAVPVQRAPGGKAAVWLIQDRLPAGDTRRYQLQVADEAAPEVVGCTEDSKQLTLHVGERPMLRYNCAVVPAPNPNEPYYARSGYLHPVYDPAGGEVTGDFAADHPHQHGIMFAWTNTTFEGRKINFWDQKAGTGRVEHVAVVSSGGGPVFAHFTTRLRHLDLTAGTSPKPVLNETWHVRAYSRADAFVFDLTSTQTCAGESPLQINQYHYGAMAIRGPEAWLQPGAGDFLTNAGKTRADGNHSRPQWCDLYGTTDGKQSGVTVLGHPGNFRAPQPVRLHPSKPYFSWSPMVLGGFAIEPGKPYVSRYRYCVHTGKPDPRAADAQWHDYADPPRVRVVE